MRARSERSHHSRTSVPAVNCPRRTTPSDSSAMRAASASAPLSPRGSPSASAVTGPRISIRPRRSSRVASARSHSTARSRSGGSIAACARPSGKSARSCGSRSAATHRGGRDGSWKNRPARRAAIRCSKSRRQEAASRAPAAFPAAASAPASDRASTSASLRKPDSTSASCSSSSVCASGHASARTRAIA